MAKIQLVSCFVNLSGDRNNTVFKGGHGAITFPEALVLQSVHGGAEHVHTLVEVGAVERDADEEMARLTEKYGSVVSDLFPAVGGRATLPLGDENLPNEADKAAAEAAMAEALAASKAGKAKKTSAKAKEAPAGDTLPSLDELPG